MTNQLNFSPTHNALNWNKLWLFSKIFLSVLVIITLLSAFAEMPSVFYISNMVLCTLFVAIIVLISFIKKRAPLLKIADNNVYYLCPVTKEAVTIPASDIIKVTTQFCELQIHTSTRTHCLNMDKIKQESQRWAIKEMIKKLVLENEKRVSGF
ncbi:MAG: hypothetical protein EOP43_05540 [Sphingobacteriaceae bacterium]|nr:MAG: hypothetical protein EOP43_05540 [Sphingobacteriaceae bacterium]